MGSGCSHLPIAALILALALCQASADASAEAPAGTPAEQSANLFKQAYAANEAGRYAEALAGLDEAVRLDPDNVRAWHERAYSLNSLGRYKEAIASFDEEVRRRNDPKTLYQERAFAKHRLADFAGAFADIDHDAKLQPDDPEALLGRARAALWLGRLEAAKADATAAADMAKRTGNTKAEAHAAEELRRIAEWSGPGRPERCKLQDIRNADVAQSIIGDCSAAYLAATLPSAKAEALTTRSTAWMIVNDSASWLDDLQIAAALDPNNPDRHANLGFAYTTDRHSTAGLEEFDKAIALGGKSFAIYGGRAGAYYNLGKTKEAFADAKKSMEMKPNEIALLVLGDLAANVDKDTKSAKLYWMGAYHLGSRDDGLRERLRSVGVDHPENEPAPK